MSFNDLTSKPESIHAQTRELLLQAAGEVFADAGFRAATVREICQRAGANIAAVNYHFGDKERLYLQVLLHAHRRSLELYPTDVGMSPDTPAEERLKTFVHGFLQRILASGPLAWHGKLIAMEMIQPTAALDVLQEESLRPLADEVQGIVERILGPGATPEIVRLCGCSIVSQCVFYLHCRSVICRLYPEQQYGERDVARLAEHITQFSLSALKAFATNV